jgi:hypothetical protein
VGGASPLESSSSSSLATGWRVCAGCGGCGGVDAGVEDHSRIVTDHRESQARAALKLLPALATGVLFYSILLPTKFSFLDPIPRLLLANHLISSSCP